MSSVAITLKIRVERVKGIDPHDLLTHGLDPILKTQLFIRSNNRLILSNRTVTGTHT